MSLLEPRPPGDRASVYLLLLIVASILAASIALLAVGVDSPLLERKAPILLVSQDGVRAGVAVIVSEGSGGVSVRVPRDLAGHEGILILVEPVGGEARVYAARWSGSPLGLPWLARLSLAGSAEAGDLGGACGYQLESIDHVARDVELVAAQLSVGEGLSGVLALLYTGGSPALAGTGVVTVNGRPVPLEGLEALRLPLGPELRGAADAPATLIVKARLVAAEAVLSGGGCRLTLGVALLEPLGAELVAGEPPQGAYKPVGGDRCEPKLVRQEDLGKPLTVFNSREPLEPYAFPLELGGGQKTALLNLSLEQVRLEATVKPLKPGQYMVCTMQDIARNPLPLARAFPVAATGPHGGG